MRDTHCLSVKIVGVNDAVHEHKDNPMLWECLNFCG